MTSRNSWTEEETKFLKENYEEMTDKELSKHLNHPVDSIPGKRYDLGLRKHSHKHWTDEEVGFLKKSYSNTTNKEIARMMNRTECSICRKAQKLNLSTSKKFISKRIGIANTKEAKDLEINPDLGYILGVIYGDGHLAKRGYTIQLIVTDEAFALEFKRNLEDWCGMEVKMKKESRKGNHKDVWRVVLYSKTVCSFLKGFDIFRLTNCERKIKTNFLRGLFDSDGCVSIHRVVFNNTNKRLVKLCKKLLSSVNIRSTKRARERKGVRKEYIIQIGSKKNIVSFNELVGFSIPRKQDRLKNVISNCKYSHWIDEEINFLEKNYKEMKTGEIAEKLGKDKKSVYAKAHQLGLRKVKKWNKEMVKEKIIEIREELGHSPSHREANKLCKGLTQATGKYGGWNKIKRELGLEIRT